MTKTGRTIVAVATVSLLAAGATGVRLATRERPHSETASSPDTPEVESAPARRPDGAQTQHQLGLLSSRLASLEKEAAERPAAAAAPTSAPARTTPRPRRPTRSPEDMQALARARVQQMDAAFEREGVDPTFAEPATRAITAAFKPGAADGVSVLSAACKSTFCRVEVLAPEHGGLGRVEALETSVAMSSYFQPTTDASGRPTVLIYFASREAERDADHVFNRVHQWY